MRADKCQRGVLSTVGTKLFDSLFYSYEDEDSKDSGALAHAQTHNLPLYIMTVQ